MQEAGGRAVTTALVMVAVMGRAEEAKKAKAVAESVAVGRVPVRAAAKVRATMAEDGSCGRNQCSQCRLHTRCPSTLDRRPGKIRWQSICSRRCINLVGLLAAWAEVVEVAQEEAPAGLTAASLEERWAVAMAASTVERWAVTTEPAATEVGRDARHSLSSLCPAGKTFRWSQVLHPDILRC